MYCSSKKTVNAWCHLPFERVKINSEGQLNFCCHMGTKFIGNVLEKPFEDIWFSNDAENVRDELRKGIFHHMCDTQECTMRYIPTRKRMNQFQVLSTGYPMHLELDLHGSHCNFGGKNPTPETACIMCPRSRPDFHKHLEAHPDKTAEIVQKVKHITPYLREINILGIAEPFWEDKIFDVLEEFDLEKHKNVSVWSTSNGSVFNSETRAKFAKIANSSTLDFSIDAASPETFLKIRKQKNFHRVCENIRAWCEERPPNKHVVNIHNNINLLNLHEVPEMVMLAKELGIDVLKLLPTHGCGNKELKDITVNAENAQAFYNAEVEAKKIGAEIGQQIYISRPLSLDYKVIKAS